MINFIKMIYQTLKCNIQTVLQEPKKKKNCLLKKKKSEKLQKLHFQLDCQYNFYIFM